MTNKTWSAYFFTCLLNNLYVNLKEDRKMWVVILAENREGGGLGIMRASLKSQRPWLKSLSHCSLYLPVCIMGAMIAVPQRVSGGFSDACGAN